MKNHKEVVVMGAACVGKSSVLSQFLHSRFNQFHKETVEDYHHKEFVFGGYSVSLNILDTSGSLSFPAMRKLSICKGDIFVLVYAINDEKSVKEVIALRNQIMEEKEGKQHTIIIVGNKSDLESERRVEKDNIDHVAYTLDIEHIETSAKLNRNIDSVFKKVLTAANIPSYLTKNLLTRQMSLPVKNNREKNKLHVKKTCVIS
ncbi:dexamethasone-induced Ras-related protein 1-like [Glandiceps talaboti]